MTEGVEGITFLVMIRWYPMKFLLDLIQDWVRLEKMFESFNVEVFVIKWGGGVEGTFTNLFIIGVEPT